MHLFTNRHGRYAHHGRYARLCGADSSEREDDGHRRQAHLNRDITWPEENDVQRDQEVDTRDDPPGGPHMQYQ